MTKLFPRVSEKSKEAEMKSYECFVCAAKSDAKGLSLMQCQTAFSRITLGEKLQEILGTKYLVLISAKDGICWDCAMFMNYIDRFEHKIELMKEHFYDKIHVKYKRIKVCLQEEDLPQQEIVKQAELPPPPPPPTKPVKHVHFQEVKEDVRGGRRRKEYSCKYCGKEYVSLVSLTMHIQKSHAFGESCTECEARFDNKAKLKRHMRDAHAPPGKELTCVSCGFHTTNTEVYCRHVCNSSIVSLTCISCNKRYVDSNFRDVKGSYKCQQCQVASGAELLGTGEKVGGRSGSGVKDTTARGEVPEVERHRRQEEATEEVPDEQSVEVVMEEEEEEEEVVEEEEEEEAMDEEGLDPTHLRGQPSPQQEEITGSELVTGMPEFLEDSEINDEDRLELLRKEEHESYLRCEGCRDEFRLRDLTQHPCFIRGDAVEFVEVEAPSTGGKSQENPLLTCKSCDFQFGSIESLRNHWDQTGHLREVNTPGNTELNRIKDKFKKTETTFKVVKQNFSIRALIPGQNEQALRANDDYKDIFIRVSDNKTDPIEDFVKRNGNSCGTCGNSFSSRDVLAQHQKNDCLTCVTCGINFYDNKLLKKHYLCTGHANKIRIQESTTPVTPDRDNTFGFKCHLCVKTFPSRFLLRKHFLVHYRGTDKGACQFCLLEFDNKNDILQHVLEVHGAHLYKCSFCDRTFMTEMFKKRHEEKHKENTPVDCSMCNVKFPNQKSLLLHNETYHNGTTCKHCGKVVEDPIALKNHERRHYIDKELECGLCKKRFRSRASLLAHSKRHSADEMKYQCEFCLLGFLSDEALKDHKLTHSTRGRKCTICNLSFKSRAQYCMHTKTHNTSYPCTVCNRTFRDSSLLAIHRRKHWRVRPYQCPQCPCVFSVSSTLLRHLYSHSKQYPHRCGMCKKGFLTRHAYHRHMETVHAVSNSFQPRRPNIPSLPLNATDEDIFHAADTLIADDSIMFNEYPNKEMEQSSSSDLITNEVVVETTELFDEILH